MFFHGGCGVGLVNGIGLRGCLLRWRMVMNKGSFVYRALVSVCVPVGEGLVGAPGCDAMCLCIWSCVVLGSLCGVGRMRVGGRSVPC